MTFRNKMASATDYITINNLTDHDAYDSEEYWNGLSPQGHEIALGIDYEYEPDKIGVFVDGVLYDNIDILGDFDKAFTKAIERLSIYVFELENNVKFPRDYWGRPILGGIECNAAFNKSAGADFGFPEELAELNDIFGQIFVYGTLDVPKFTSVEYEDAINILCLLMECGMSHKAIELANEAIAKALDTLFDQKYDYKRNELHEVAPGHYVAESIGFQYKVEFIFDDANNRGEPSWRWYLWYKNECVDSSKYDIIMEDINTAIDNFYDSNGLSDAFVILEGIDAWL